MSKRLLPFLSMALNGHVPLVGRLEGTPGYHRNSLNLYSVVLHLHEKTRFKFLDCFFGSGWRILRIVAELERKGVKHL